MNIKQIEELIKNRRISDKNVAKVIEEYTADRYRKDGTLLPISKDHMRGLESLGVLTEELRPRIMEKLRQKFLVKHSKTCLACQKGEHEGPE